MNSKDFIKNTILDLNPQEFNRLKTILVGEYIQFSFVESDNIDQAFFSEKVCDYIEKLEFRNKTSFQKLLVNYSIYLDKLVANKVARATKANNNDSELTPRARRYYEKAKSNGKKQFQSTSQVIDYVRVMLCLYTASLQSPSNPIENFNLSIDTLSIENLIFNMKQEQAKRLNYQVKEYFLKNGIYSAAVFYLIMTIIIYCHLMSNMIQGEY